MRRSQGAGSPFEAVSLPKQTRIARAAALFLVEFPELAALDCRFDVVGVEPDQDGSLCIEHLTNAFQAPDALS